MVQRLSCTRGELASDFWSLGPAQAPCVVRLLCLPTWRSQALPALAQGWQALGVRCSSATARNPCCKRVPIAATFYPVPPHAFSAAAYWPLHAVLTERDWGSIPVVQAHARVLRMPHV
jgi:hypothetical protein